ncbi:MAG: hypothetical protein HPY79_08875 [Bacteroidales bacterium]|nr:hypothetical protein [Bacteroidales bacterium]
MKTILFGLFVFLMACNQTNNVEKTTESKVSNDSFAQNKKGVKIEELVKDTTKWELLEDSVIIDGTLCDKYRNKKTQQIIFVAYE